VARRASRSRRCRVDSLSPTCSPGRMSSRSLLSPASTRTVRHCGPAASAATRANQAVRPRRRPARRRAGSGPRLPRQVAKYDAGGTLMWDRTVGRDYPLDRARSRVAIDPAAARAGAGDRRRSRTAGSSSSRRSAAGAVAEASANPRRAPRPRASTSATANPADEDLRLDRGQWIPLRHQTTEADRPEADHRARQLEAAGTGGERPPCGSYWPTSPRSPTTARATARRSKDGVRGGSGGGTRGGFGADRVSGRGRLCWRLRGRMMGCLTCGRDAVSEWRGGGVRAVSDTGSDGRVASVSDNPGDTVSDKTGGVVCVSNKSGAVSDRSGDAVLVSNKSGAVSDRSGAVVLVSNKSGSRRSRVR
jgi:hypothetical protein